ncbi:MULTISPECIES: flavin reductase family protein [Microbacterium]|uniref:flavin reductase family protein n=1 Tax=Microbacterium TaxID=33882 RepID=UPI000C2CCE8D|nr:flavin reductase family protein [Microbacterium lacus]
MTSESPTPKHAQESSSGGGALVLDTLSADDFRAIFRRHPAGVTVVTADAGTGPVALTATSVASMSADPPLLIFSVSSSSSSARVLKDANTVVVHFIGPDSIEIAKLGATSGIDRFADSTIWSRLPTGEVVFDAVRTWIRARVVNRLEASGSTIVIAQAIESNYTAAELDQQPEREGLVFMNRSWHQVGERSAII